MISDLFLMVVASCNCLISPPGSDSLQSGLKF